MRCVAPLDSCCTGLGSTARAHPATIASTRTGGQVRRQELQQLPPAAKVAAVPAPAGRRAMRGGRRQVDAQGGRAWRVQHRGSAAVSPTRLGAHHLRIMLHSTRAAALSTRTSPAAHGARGEPGPASDRVPDTGGAGRAAVPAPHGANRRRPAARPPTLTDGPRRRLQAGIQAVWGIHADGRARGGAAVERKVDARVGRLRAGGRSVSSERVGKGRPPRGRRGHPSTASHLAVRLTSPPAPPARRAGRPPRSWAAPTAAAPAGSTARRGRGGCRAARRAPRHSTSSVGRQSGS